MATALTYATRELSASVGKTVMMASTDLMHRAVQAADPDLVSRASELTPGKAAKQVD